MTTPTITLIFGESGGEIGDAINRYTDFNGVHNDIVISRLDGSRLIGDLLGDMLRRANDMKAPSIVAGIHAENREGVANGFEELTGISIGASRRYVWKVLAASEVATTKREPR